MKILLTLAFLLFNCTTVFAQSDIEREIRNLPDTPSDVITKARRLLRKEFTDGNLLKVKAIKEYLLDSLSNDSVAGFLPEEIVLLNYWTQDFAKILSEISNPTADPYSRGYRDDRFPPYFFGEPIIRVLNEKSHKHSDTLFSFIQSSSYSQQDKDFLKLHLHSVLFETQYYRFYHDKDFQTRDELNQLADTFLKEYPDSKYENYIRRNIRVVFRRSETAVVVDLSIGAGVYSGQMAHSFQTGLVTGLGAEYNFKNLGILGRLAFEDGKTKSDISMNDVPVKKGATLQMVSTEIGASYCVFENRLFKIAPLATVGFATYNPLQKDIDENPGLENATKGFNFIYTLGLNWDFKLGSILDDSFYFPLRFRYGYTALDFKSSGMRGGMHSVTVGIGLYFGENERDY